MSGRTFAAQDLPPQGGYDALHIARKKLAGIIRPRYFFAIFGTVVTMGLTTFAINHRRTWRDIIEMRSAKNAILPILMAENDRKMLKHMKVMRERETEIMKDSDGWTVGKYYGEPIYVTMGDDYYAPLTWQEYYMFTNRKAATFYTLDWFLL